MVSAVDIKYPGSTINPDLPGRISMTLGRISGSCLLGTISKLTYLGSAAVCLESSLALEEVRVWGRSLGVDLGWESGSRGSESWGVLASSGLGRLTIEVQQPMYEFISVIAAGYRWKRERSA
jgi:hypothetical protein